jgi:hypothetical protein
MGELRRVERTSVASVADEVEVLPRGPLPEAPSLLIPQMMAEPNDGELRKTDRSTRSLRLHIEEAQLRATVDAHPVEAPSDANATPLEIDILPAQRQDLGAPGSGRRGE